jgi:rhamnosyltransferase
MATYNGERWLAEQLDSFIAQTGVDLDIIVSDDQSSDNTLNILKKYSDILSLKILPSSPTKFGKANLNFIRLICESDIGDAQFIALADQDDIWREIKLQRAIDQLRVSEALAYSSDFEAFWPDGRKIIVKKSYPQKQYDHLFGSPGPGCTFVLKRSFFLEVRSWIKSNLVVLSTLWVHDWFLYAYARMNGRLWIIDSLPTLLYRQHHSNEIGVNIGLKAMLRRIAVILEGKYRRDIINIAELNSVNNDIVRSLRRFNWYDRFWLIWHADKFRRSPKDVFALRIIFIIMPNRLNTSK